MTVLKVCRVDGAELPKYAHKNDAGLDLCSTETVLIFPQERKFVSTGIAVDIPAGHVGLVHPRSGMALNHGITVLNAPGTIDSGYHGEIKVILYNTSSDTYRIDPGDKIAQLVIQEYVKVWIDEVSVLSDSERGTNGFGSTGS